jgi:hypothetical protein
VLVYFDVKIGLQMICRKGPFCSFVAFCFGKKKIHKDKIRWLRFTDQKLELSTYQGKSNTFTAVQLVRMENIDRYLSLVQTIPGRQRRFEIN